MVKARFINESKNITVTGENQETRVKALSQSSLVYTAGEGIQISGLTIAIDDGIVAKKTDIPTEASDVSALPDTTKYGKAIDVSLNESDYKLTISLKDQDGGIISSKTVDFPIESVVVGGSYDNNNKSVVLTLKNGNTINVPVGDLVYGLQSEITAQNKLDADLVDDSTSVHKFGRKWVFTNPHLGLYFYNKHCYWEITGLDTKDVIIQLWRVNYNGVNSDRVDDSANSGNYFDYFVMSNETSPFKLTIGFKNLTSTSQVAAGKFKVVILG